MDLLDFFNMMLHVDQTLGLVISQYGTLIYVILFAIIFCETGLIVLPFLPGDSLLFIAGAFCANDAMDIGILMPLLFTAAVLGNTLNYWIGRLVGNKVYHSPNKWINQAALQKTHIFYEKHGGKTIVLARFLPIVRTFAPFVAGVSQMKHTTFQCFNCLGALLWILLFLVGGYFLGNAPFIREHLNSIVLIGVSAAIIPLLLGGAYRLIQKRLFMR